MGNYRTASRNFTNRFTEKTYSPDENLIKQLHAYMDLDKIFSLFTAKDSEFYELQKYRVEQWCASKVAEAKIAELEHLLEEVEKSRNEYDIRDYMIGRLAGLKLRRDK